MTSLNTKRLRTIKTAVFRRAIAILTVALEIHKIVRLEMFVYSHSIFFAQSKSHTYFEILRQLASFETLLPIFLSDFVQFTERNKMTSKNSFPLIVAIPEIAEHSCFTH